MITNRLLPLALVLGSLTPAQAQYKAIFSFGASGDPSCSSSETLAQTPGGKPHQHRPQRLHHQQLDNFE